MNRFGFSRWFEEVSKDKGNDKAFRNRKGMEEAWHAGQAKQRQMCADAVEHAKHDIDARWMDIDDVKEACLNATGESENDGIT